MEREFISIGESAGLIPKEQIPAEQTPPATPAVKTEEPPAPQKPTETPPAEDFITAFEQEMIKSNPEFKIKDGYKDLTPQERVNYLREEIVSSEPSKQPSDPFIESYIKAKANGLTENDFVQQRTLVETVTNMDSREFLIQDLLREGGKTEERPNGWTQQDVEEEVDSMGIVRRDTEAKARKERIFSQIDDRNSKYNENRKIEIKENSIKANQGPIKETIEKLFTEMETINDFGGIPHTVEDQKDFRPIFEKYAHLNPETGQPMMRELFNDDKRLYQILYLDYKFGGNGKGSVKAGISDFKEGYKQEILDKTRIAPRNESGKFQNVALPDGDTFV